MLPIPTPECNFTYKAPEGMPDCQDLPCYRHEQGTTSFWQPDDSERRMLEQGGTVAFTHFGQGHPVVGLGVMPAEGTAHKPDVNSEAWQHSFINSTCATMRKAGVACMIVALHEEDAGVYEMFGDRNGSISRKDIINILLGSQLAGIRFTLTDAQELCENIFDRATLPEKREAVTDEQPVHDFFGLSYANYLVLPRVLLQSCTVETQRALCSALKLVYQEEEHHLGEHWPEMADIEVKLRDVATGQFKSDPMADYNRGRRRLW